MGQVTDVSEYFMIVTKYNINMKVANIGDFTANVLTLMSERG